MTEAFNEAIRGKLAGRKTVVSKKKSADPAELLGRAEAAIEELQAVLAELAAAEPHEDGPAEDEEA